MITTQEQAFADDLMALLAKHGYTRKDAVPALMAMRAAPKIVIHMIGFENLILSKYCIESILANTPSGVYRLIITNNGSTDGTREYFDQIASQFDHVTVIHESENTGFQAPNEKAFAIARSTGAEFFCPINNDVELPAGWLESLLEPLGKNSRGAVAGPFGGCSRVNSDMCGCDDTKLEFVEFSCAAVRVSAITTPTLFAPFLSFIYGEDLQLCLDLQFKGWTIHRAPFRIKHRGSQTAGAHPLAKKKCAEANARNLAEMRKRYSHWNKVRRFDYPIVLKRSYAVGDVLLMTPVIRALHEKYPMCPIYVETDYPAIFEGNPCVRHAFTGLVPDKPMNPDALFINLDGSYEATPQMHVIDAYALKCGLEPSDVKRRLEYFGIPKVAKKRSGWVAVAVGPTTWPSKNWETNKWNSVIQYLRGEGLKVMLFGDAPKDASFLVDSDMRGQSGIKEFAALISTCDLMVCLDSFPMHLSMALDVPCVPLFGVTNPECFCAEGEVYPVRSDPSHPDTGRRNREANVTYINADNSVMKTISVESVITSIEASLRKHSENV